MSSDLDEWFADNILPHEAALTRYLRRAWRNPQTFLTFVRTYMSASTKAQPTVGLSFPGRFYSQPHETY